MYLVDVNYFCMLIKFIYFVLRFEMTNEQKKFVISKVTNALISLATCFAAYFLGGAN